MSECLRMFGKKSFLHPGIAHHINTDPYYCHVGYDRVVVVVIPSAKDGAAWEKWITNHLADRYPDDPEARWWYGFDVGASSATLFGVLAGRLAGDVRFVFNRAATPQDAADLGRCHRLLAQMPHWKTRLPEVAARHPDTHWPAIIARWDELERVTPEIQTLILREIHSQKN